MSAAPRLTVGSTAPGFSFYTPAGGLYALYDALQRHRYTVVWFLRYYGCPVCQLDLHELAACYPELESRDTGVLAVLQSAPDTLREALGEQRFPFPLVCDPTCAIYDAWAVASASSIAKLLGVSGAGKAWRAQRAGYRHGAYEGREEQLPALFLLARDGRVKYARYAKNLADLPAARQLPALVDGLGSGH